jgi:hypothetical protein
MITAWRKNNEGSYNLPSLDTAPSRKKSHCVSATIALAAPPAACNFAALLLTRMFLSCSKTVYWSTGLITSIIAGPIPRQNAAMPPSASIFWIVWSMDSFFAWGGSSENVEGSRVLFMVCTAWEVCTTHIGLLTIVVAEPYRTRVSTGSGPDQRK